MQGSSRDLAAVAAGTSPLAAEPQGYGGTHGGCTQHTQPRRSPQTVQCHTGEQPGPSSGAVCVGLAHSWALPCILGKGPPGTPGGCPVQQCLWRGPTRQSDEHPVAGGRGGARSRGWRGVKWEWVQGQAAGMQHTGTLFGWGGRKSGRWI